MRRLIESLDLSRGVLEPTVPGHPRTSAVIGVPSLVGGSRRLPGDINIRWEDDPTFGVLEAVLPLGAFSDREPVFREVEQRIDHA